VDANGGWDLEKAIHMSQWLAERGVSYIEQPLKEGAEEQPFCRKYPPLGTGSSWRKF